MTHILHRAANADLPVAVSGAGVEIVDAEGRRYLDASGGAAVSCLGHGHPDVDRGAAPATRRARLRPYRLLHLRARRAARRPARGGRAAGPRPASIWSAAGPRRSRPRSRWRGNISSRRGEPQRRRIVARRQSYHGNTLGALATGGNAWRRAPFEPLLIETHHIDPCYAYRLQRRRRKRRRLRRPRRAGARGQARRARPRERHRLRRRDRGRRHVRRRAAGRRLFQARARDLRPIRRAAHPRRGHVRHGAHRNAARLRAGGRRARPHDHRQGPRRRLPADRRGPVG